MLERPADPDSAHWSQQLASGRATVRDVARDIAKSPEHTQRFWRQEAGEDTPFYRAVGTLYRHILGRQPDPAGARSWSEQTARRGVDSIVDEIVASREYQNAFGDWGVLGSGGLRFCGPTNQTSAQPRSQTAKMRFRGMDRNNDGVITSTEWWGSRQSFRVHDWNGDGVLR